MGKILRLDTDSKYQKKILKYNDVRIFKKNKQEVPIENPILWILIKEDSR